MSEPTLILTGASAGIGLAILEALAPEAFVIAVSRTPPPLQEFNGVWIKGDLQEAEAVAAELLQYLTATSRPLDGLILCAASYGADGRHPFLETTDSEWNELITVNLCSQVILTSRLLPRLLERDRAVLVGISSNTATAPAPGRIAYGCSKAASYALLTGLAEELRDSGVSVVQLMPDRQVTTRGLRRRRPPGFDFSPYIHPDAFKDPIVNIVRTRGAGMNGQCVLMS